MTKDQLIAELVELRQRIAQLETMEAKLRAMSTTDDLTGLFNRRGFFSIAPKQLRLCCRNDRNATIIYADVDGLKKINDSLGHLEGDNALKDVAEIIRETFRESDIVARMGGDEFVILMPETSESNAENVINRLQQNIKNNKGRKRNYGLSMSVGLAYYDSQKPCSIDELLSQADKSMYVQKKQLKMIT